jgi:lipoprotein signal peptidase
MPILLLSTQFAVLTKINAIEKLTNMVVMVKKMFNPECFHLSYLALNKGMAFSMIKNRVNPPISIAERCADEMVEK